MKVFISGPITGMPNLNREAFADAEELIRSYGHEPVNPHVICAHLDPERDSHERFMDTCLSNLLSCDAIYKLKNPHNSLGMELEAQYAQCHGIPDFSTRVSFAYIPERAIYEVYGLMTQSEQGKHKGRDWRALGAGTHIDHANSHLGSVLEFGSNDTDKESGFFSLTHAAARMLQALECELIRKEKS